MFPLYQARLDSLFEAFNLQLKVRVSQLFQKINNVVDTQLLSRRESLDRSQLTMDMLLAKQSVNTTYQLQFSKQIENMFGQMKKTIQE